MDAENDNDQPNSSSASASSSSSSNNSSSSNLLSHLPILPFMRSTDDDELEADGEADGNDNELNEEPMPLQTTETVVMAAAAAAQPASASVQQPTLAPITTTTATSSTSATSSAATAALATTTASSSLGRGEPMVGAEQLAVLTSSSASSSLPPSYPSSLSSSSSSSLSSNSFSHLPSSVFLPPTNPSQVFFTPYLFNHPSPLLASLINANNNPSLSPTRTPLQIISASSPINDNNPTLLTSSLPSSSASISMTTSTSSPQTQSHEIHNNLAQNSQLPLFHEQPPISSTSFSVSSQQQHQAQLQTSTIDSSSVSTPYATLQQLLAAGQPQRDQEQQLTAQINRNDIADTIDASAVIVQPLEANAEYQQHPHLYPQAAASSEEVEQRQRDQLVPQPNDIQLDDNDNNDFDVDLNLRNVGNDSSLAHATTSNHHRHQSQQESQQPITLDTFASSSVGPSPSTATGRQHHQPPQTLTLPLLLQQQQQQQQQHQTQESKHLPSYNHHYNNLHAYPYQHPCVYPYGRHALSPTQQRKQQQSNGASSNNSVFSTNMSVRHNTSTSGLGGGRAVSSSTSGRQSVDRLKLLYPNVNENETPLPRCWSSHEKCLSIGLSQNNLRVLFKGVAKQSNEAASVRTAHPIPPACGIYYFEVKIISKGKNGYMGIGLTAQNFRMNRLPGWDKQSYGYHGDDGNSFSSSGHGQSYGPTFTTGDVIGCCVNFVNNTCFYTKNGVDLGIAFRELPTRLFPTVGLQTPGEEVDANFGQEPFKFDQFEEMIKQMRGETKATIYDFPLPAEQGDPTTLLQKMVSSYLVHNGYSQTSEAFARQKTGGQNQKEDISSIRNRQKIIKLVMSGKMGQAIEQTMRLYPGLLESNKNLWFMLKCRQFIEMINGSDLEYCSYSSSSPSTTTTANKTTNSITTQTSPPNQTSVIQSTKSYQNGNEPNNSSNGSATTDVSPSAITIAATTTTTANTTSHNSSCNTNTTTAINNAQNSTSHMTVINTDDLKTQSNLVDNDDPATICKSSNDDYLNDVEMENNGHTTNGNICKNGNTNNFNDSIEADEEMDVDISPAVKKYGHGIERILEFGKDLSQMGQQLEKDNKITDEERQMLEDAFSLIAYSNPWASPLGWQLCPTKRETVCRALNSAILESLNYPKWTPLEYCVAHANELLKVMAQASIGVCAFVNIADVFPKN